MWRWRKQFISFGLEEAALARSFRVGTASRFRLPSGPAAFLVGAEAQRLTAGRSGTARVQPGQTVLIVRERDSLTVAFDTLRASDRCLMEVHLEIRMKLKDAGCFHASLMIGRDELRRDDVARLAKERIKFPARRALREFPADSIERDRRVPHTIQEMICNGGELARWAEQNGLMVESITLMECFPALDPLVAKAELEQARAIGETSLADTLERLRHDKRVRRYERAAEILDSQADLAQKTDALLGLYDRLERRDTQRCQQCHTVIEEGFECKACGRSLCRIHEHQDGMCRSCFEERQERKKESPVNEIYKCPISGHFVARTDTFECQGCKTVACNHCFDAATSKCVRCAAAAAEEDGEKRQQRVADLLAELRALPQRRDLRLWCDSHREVRRGVGVAPKSDVRVFRLGDDIRFQYHAEFDGYLRLLAVQSDAASVPLFPNEFSSDYRVEGGQTCTFPGEDAEFHYFAKEPVGLDTILAVVAPVPFQLLPDDSPADAEEAVAAVCDWSHDVETTLNILRSLIKQVESGKWTCAQCQLIVRA